MIYFDNASTSKIDPRVRDEMLKAYDEYFGNPSALHSLGFKSEKRLRLARKTIADFFSVKDRQIFFCPSSTIGNNTVLKSVSKGKKGNIVLSSIEHSSVYKAAKELENIDLRLVKVDNKGFIDREDLLSKLDDDTILVSILHVNNEIGTINDINALAREVKSINPKTLFHSDGAQALKKIDISLDGIDFYVFSGHKINGPKGIAGLFVRNPENLLPLYYGGGQEEGKFSGTENLQAIIGLAEAIKLDYNRDKVHEINRFLRREISEIKDCVINSPEESSSDYILNVCFADIGGEILLHYLEMEDVYVSTGSACNRNSKSRTLEAIGLDDRYMGGCVRISFDRNSSMDEAKAFIKILKEKINIIREVVKR